MVVRVNKNSNYTVMSNHHLMNRNLSLKAKGLLSVILSLPEGWDYSIAGLAAISKEKESSINTALKELKENGYLVITKKMPNETETGRIAYEWDFYEIPADQKQEDKKQGLENQGLEFLRLEVQGLEDQGQLNTNILNTNKENTKEEITKEIDIMQPPKKTKFVPPTVDEVQAYCIERGNNIDAQRFVDYYTANGWVQGSKGKPIKNWQACIRTWEKNSYGFTFDKRSGGNEFTDLLEQMEV